MTREENAVSLFFEGFSCSQAVLDSFADELGVTSEQARKISSCFGAGMRKGEVCGACTGALMVLGLKYSTADAADKERKYRANQLAVRFLERFAQLNGSYICNTILGCDISTPEGMQFANGRGMFRTVCPKMVASAVSVLEEIISEN